MPKGKIPSLLSANNGGIVYDTAQRSSDCSRCKTKLASGSRVGLLKVQRSGFTNHKRFCMACIVAILDKTREELDALAEKAELNQV